jgi:hypothetical protein
MDTSGLLVEHFKTLDIVHKVEATTFSAIPVLRTLLYSQVITKSIIRIFRHDFGFSIGISTEKYGMMQGMWLQLHCTRIAE